MKRRGSTTRTTGDSSARIADAELLVALVLIGLVIVVTTLVVPSIPG